MQMKTSLLFLILLLFAICHGSQIINISENAGIMPIKMGQAKLQKSKHTFVHYYNLTPIFEEFENLNKQYDLLRAITINKTDLNAEVENNNKITQYTRQNIIQKINHITIYSKIRVKRGIIDGLGSIFKQITGNLDAEDGKRYNTILNHLEENQHSLQNQLKLEYSINHQIIEKFNKSIENVRHNEKQLKDKIQNLSKIMKRTLTTQEVLLIKDLYNQLSSLYNSILNTLQDIENSITFCKIKTLHPSIINPSQLLDELKRISDYYKSQLPYEAKFENLLDIEALLTVNCKISPNHITYFISIPINFEKDFDLFYLQPLPTRRGSEYVTIIPNTRYFLKNQNEIMPLNNMCSKSRIYQCKNIYHPHFHPSCEEDILTQQNTSRCQYTKLELTSHMELIPEINQYLGVFPQTETIKIKCPDKTDIKTLTGVYLIRQSQCDITFKNKQLTYQDKTYGQPILLPKLNFIIKSHKLANISLKLKTIKLEDISFKYPVETINTPIIHHVPSVWTVLIYFGLFLIIIYYVWKCFMSKHIKSTQNGQQPQPEGLQLPGEASF